MIKRNINTVAPVRERGLKFEPMGQSTANPSRSREGAWIEMALTAGYNLFRSRRSREGAWIEI